MLEKKVVIESIDVLEDGHIQVREVTKVLEDGKELGKSYKRWVIYPGADTKDEIKKVKDIAGVVHTQEVIDSYIDKLSK